ncbi:MAG: gamma-glutamyltransferase [Gammaproteobacteria bacterium]|nr:gamma-glutamyltransferase [Gammaproteobacteria bacterium]
MKRLYVFSLLCLLIPVAWAEAPRPNVAAIASAHPLATAAGHEILARGGNAFDAAVAVAAALAVVEPHGSGLGGGGFWLLHRESDGFETMVDARERAPRAARANMYLDAAGNPIPRRSLDGALAAAIPGTPAALAHVAAKYGRLPLAVSLAPAIRYAREGFTVTPAYRKWITHRVAALRASSAAARVFLDRQERPALGHVVRQPELAEVLARLGADGARDFYQSDTARLLIAGVHAAGGIWTHADLAQYRVLERAPVRTRYRGMHVTAAALPSSGGVVLAQMLGMLEGFEFERMDRVTRLHTILGAMRLAYRDRARHLGDPDHVRVDVERLLSPAYLESLRNELRNGKREEATPVREVVGVNTTHFSIIDRDGNRAAVTLSLNGPFGSGFMPPGTGVLLNNEMDDFVLKPGVANLYGLTGSMANAIAPGKRPLSSMTPTFLETDNKVVVLGTPGGSRIITMVLLAALEVAHGHGDPLAWVTDPRFHHQFSPDRVEYEPGAFTPDEILALTQHGHALAPREETYGNMQLVVRDKKTHRLEAVSDPRGEGLGLTQ